MPMYHLIFDSIFPRKQYQLGVHDGLGHTHHCQEGPPNWKGAFQELGIPLCMWANPQQKAKLIYLYYTFFKYKNM